MGNKYSGLQIGIHWLVFLLVIVAYSAMEFRGFFPRSYRPLFNMVHVSCGITILTLMVARLLVRLKYPAPPIVPKPKPMMTGMAHLGHLVIYLLFIVLPIIGLVMMYNRGNPWIAFGIVMPHAPEANFDLVDMLKSARDAGKSGLFCYCSACWCCPDASLFLEGQYVVAHDAAKTLLR